jgi:hypothetical protein
MIGDFQQQLSRESTMVRSDHKIMVFAHVDVSKAHQRSQSVSNGRRKDSILLPLLDDVNLPFLTDFRSDNCKTSVRYRVFEAQTY